MPKPSARPKSTRPKSRRTPSAPKTSARPRRKPPGPLASHKLVAFAATRDRERAKLFYRDTLGLRLISDDPFALVFDAAGTMLRVTPVPSLAPAGYTVLGWNVPSITRAATGLKKAGVAFERFPGLQQDQLGIWTAPSKARIAWFKDPDGNILSISQH